METTLLSRRPARHVHATLVAVLSLAAAIAGPALASPALASEPADAIVSGFQAELLLDLERLEEKMVGLAEAIPAESYGWRPAEGVRSVSEALAHVVTTDHRLLAALGRELPEGLDELESTTDRETLVAELRGAFAAVRETVEGTDIFSLEEEVEVFGRRWSRRAVLYLIATHSHEHLGQMIAYARSIGVTPPWSRSAAEG